MLRNEKAVPLHRVFHGIRFKVNERLVVGMTTFFFYTPFSAFFIPFSSIFLAYLNALLYFCKTMKHKALLLSILFSLLPAGNSVCAHWRGVMIDVSRHFMPLDFLKRQVEAMSHFGLNRLHLHLSDAAGWRIESKAYPRLHTFAAWRTAEIWKEWWNDGKRHYAEEHADNAFGGYYTQEEMKQLVHYADSLGVQIIPELEFPAHSEEVTAAYPNLGCTGQPYQCADFCLGNEETYQFVDKILDEWNGIFSSPYIHLGGDEAGGAHWMDCPRCKTVMQENGFTTRKELQHYAMQRVASIAASKGKRPIMWDEAYEMADGKPWEQTLQPTSEKVSVRTPIIMVWRDTTTITKAAASGYDVIACPGRWFYLDAYQDAPMTQPEAMGGYTPFKKVREQALSASKANMQVCLWTEYIPTPEHAEYMLWPRALALSPQCNDTEEWMKESCKWLHNHNINAFPIEKEIGQRPEYETPVQCLTTGKKVRYLTPFYKGYDAGGERALTDGLRGGWTNTDGRWQGFISKARLDVVIDLEQVENVGYIKADFMQSLSPEIYLPEKVIISTSLDGERFTPIYNITPARSQLSMDYQTIGWEGPPTPTRFIRFQAMAGDRGGWIFTDEIIAQSAK